MKKDAFTLAEVLITLGIIGIVAAMTMPALVANYQKKVTVTKLKKVSSVLSQGCKMALADDGVSEIAETGFYSSILGGSGSSISKYYKIVGDTTSTDRISFFEDMLNYGYNFKLADGADVNLYYPTHTDSPDKLFFVVNINPGREKVYKNVDLFAITLNENCALDVGNGSIGSQAYYCYSPLYTHSSSCFKAIVQHGWEIKYDFSSVKRAQT